MFQGIYCVCGNLCILRVLPDARLLVVSELTAVQDGSGSSCRRGEDACSHGPNLQLCTVVPPFPASTLNSHICARLWQVASGYRNEVAATKKLTSSLKVSYTQPANSLIMVTCPKAAAVPAAKELLPTDDATVTAGSSSGCGRNA